MNRYLQGWDDIHVSLTEVENTKLNVFLGWQSHIFWQLLFWRKIQFCLRFPQTYKHDT